MCQICRQAGIFQICRETEQPREHIKNALQVAQLFVEQWPQMSDAVAAQEGFNTITAMRDRITAALEGME